MRKITKSLLKSTFPIEKYFMLLRPYASISMGSTVIVVDSATYINTVINGMAEEVAFAESQDFTFSMKLQGAAVEYVGKYPETMLILG